MESRFNNQWKSNIRWKNSPIPRLGSNLMEKLGIATPTFFKEFHEKIKQWIRTVLLVLVWHIHSLD